MTTDSPPIDAPVVASLEARQQMVAERWCFVCGLNVPEGMGAVYPELVAITHRGSCADVVGIARVAAWTREGTPTQVRTPEEMLVELARSRAARRADIGRDVIRDIAVEVNEIAPSLDFEGESTNRPSTDSVKFGIVIGVIEEPIGEEESRYMFNGNPVSRDTFTAAVEIAKLKQLGRIADALERLAPKPVPNGDVVVELEPKPV